MFARRATALCLLADSIPIYPIYALLFSHAGMSDGQISALFFLWSAFGLLVGVPTGALADKYGYRFALVSNGLLQSAGYVVWLTWQTFPGFALGFLLWGLGGALGSGALEALVYQDLKALSLQSHYTRLQATISSARLLAQVPAALSATALYPIGGFQLIGWVSVGTCALSGLYALRLPALSHVPDEDSIVEAELSYLATLRDGVAEAWRNPRVRALVLLFAALFSLDAVEEYFALLAREWGVPTGAVPAVIMSIPLLGAFGASWAGRFDSDKPIPVGLIMAASSGVFALSGLLHVSAGVAGIAVFYLGYRFAVVILEARLQHAIEGSARATVTSVADFVVDVMCLLIYALWAWGGLLSFICLALAISCALVLTRTSR